VSEVWLVRHGPTHAKSMIGWTDLPADLSDTGQLARLSAFLPDAPVVSSDLLRAQTTADAIQGARARLPHMTGLREIHFGAWEARRFDDVNTDEPAALRAFWDQPGETRATGGETWNELRTRVDAAVDHLIAEHAKVIVVAHFGAILTQVERALGITTKDVFAHKIDNLSVTHVNLGANLAPLINHLP